MAHAINTDDRNANFLQQVDSLCLYLQMPYQQNPKVEKIHQCLLTIIYQIKEEEKNWYVTLSLRNPEKMIVPEDDQELFEYLKQYDEKEPIQQLVLLPQHARKTLAKSTYDDPKVNPILTLFRKRLASIKATPFQNFKNNIRDFIEKPPVTLYQKYPHIKFPPLDKIAGVVSRTLTILYSVTDQPGYTEIILTDAENRRCENCKKNGTPTYPLMECDQCELSYCSMLACQEANRVHKLASHKLAGFPSLPS